MADVRTTADELREQWLILRARWQAVCLLWDDPVRLYFEDKYWTETERVVTQALEGMERLGELIEQVQNEFS